MPEIVQRDYNVSPTQRFTDAEGRLTQKGFEVMKAVSKILRAVNILPGEVGEEELAALAVSAAKLQDGAVIIGKLAAGSIWVDTLFVNKVVTTRTVNDNAITEAAVAVTNGDIAAPGIIQTIYAIPEGNRLLVRGGAAMYSTNGLGFPEYGYLFLAKDGVEVASYFFWVEDVPTGYYSLEYIEDNPTEAEWTMGIRDTSGTINAYGRVLNVTNLKR